MNPTHRLFLDLAAQGLRMPIGTHLVLHEHSDHARIIESGTRLGEIVDETAQRFRTPLAVPLMDLTVEKAALLTARGVPSAEIDSYHFQEPASGDDEVPLSPRMRVTCDAIAHIARRTDLIPIGMSIGPFSLMTKFLSDPITPVFLAGSGLTADDEPEIKLVEHTLAMGLRVILKYLDAQIAAGAKAIIICEPAANQVYFSPNQLVESYAVFDRYVIEPNRQIKHLLDQHGVDLIFHDCGELVDGMIRRFATLDPAILSLGSSRKLWEDAALVPKTTVLYGNLPTKKFYSDEVMPLTEVERQACELLQRMQEAGHSFILGSECDVLSVPGAERTIQAKVAAFMNCSSS